MRSLVRIRTCQTWPNRWFVHAATADGHQNNDPPHLPDVPTVFNLFEYAGNENWKIYFHDLAQAHTLLQLFLLGSHFHPYRQFQADCLTGQLPAYSFIEPQYYADLVNPENDQHTVGRNAGRATDCGRLQLPKIQQVFGPKR
ncbi:MAG: alkaline phosphatase family protein [Xanthobacteraceae bacterium]